MHAILPSGKTSHKEKHTEKYQSFGEILNGVREKNISRPFMGQLSINSIRNKFHFLQSDASKHLDILLISETKISESFPSTHILLDGFFRPYRLDRRRDTSLSKGWHFFSLTNRI